MSQVFEALIGALASEDELRASKLVLDLVAIQLHGQDLTDLWDLADPMGTLEDILSKENRGLPEARLLWSSGKETILACYHVGVYSDREIIGQGTTYNYIYLNVKSVYEKNYTRVIDLRS